MKKAVLLITFNRPNYTKQVLDALKAARVSRLYIFKDGPRPYNKADEKASKEIEQIVNEIDWDCRVKTNYMNNNLGCGWGPYSAISWAFQYEEEIIILEDDVIPSLPFFDFMDLMLEKYKNNSKVNFITGRGIAPGDKVFIDKDYVFTQYAPTLGWATWKRVWNNFSLNERFELKSFFQQRGGFTNQYATKAENRYQNLKYRLRTNPLGESFHSWDYQFYVHCRMQGELAIVPAKNLIQYIGYEGTHTIEDSFLKVKAVEKFTITKEPQSVIFDKDFESRYFASHFSWSAVRWFKQLLKLAYYTLFRRPNF